MRDLVLRCRDLCYEHTFVPVHAMKAYGGKGHIAPHILQLGSRWRWVVNFMPWLFYLQERTSVPTDYSWFQTFAVFWMLHAFFWVIPRHLNFICRHFRTLCLFHLHRWIGVEWLCLRNVGVFIGKKVWLENAWASRKEGDRLGVGPVTEQVVESSYPHGGHGLVWERDMARAGVKHRMAEVGLLCYRWSSTQATQA